MMNQKTAEDLNVKKTSCRILVTGATPYWNRVLADLLSRAGFKSDILDKYEPAKLFKWLITGRFGKYDFIYQVCGINNWINSLVLLLLAKPFVVHWIGTDVMSLTGGKASKGWRNFITRILVFKRARVHVADSPYLLDELKELGITASVVCLFPERVEADPIPLPEKFSVISYWTDNSKDFFRGDIVYRLAEDFPDIKFKILGVTGDVVSTPPNVKFLGRRNDIETVYKDCNVLIRLPKHDSLSAMVLEMLARGRYVIYNKDIPHCHYATDYDSAKEALNEIVKLTGLNLEGSDYIRENFSPAKEAEKFKTIFSGLLVDSD